MGGKSTCALTSSRVVTTVAGSTAGSSNGTGTAALFLTPYGITTDGTNLYVADSGNNRIRKIVISTGAVTTLAGSTAGNADGTGATATFNYPMGITSDGTNLYVADTNNHRIRQVVISSGVVTTLAGSTSGSADGIGTAATFSSPQGITTDGTSVFVADTFNHRIRKIAIASATVTTLAGATQGYADGTGTAATFNSPVGLTHDGTNLYVADVANHRIRKIILASAVVSTLAGAGVGNADGTGAGATFNMPYGITTDGTNLYVGDQSNHRIRRIVIGSGVVTTLAGAASGNANGTGTAATFNVPSGITTDGLDLFIADTNNNRVRKLR